MIKPNIFFILCDDLGKLVINKGLAAGLYPNILSLINGGTVFHRAYSTYALCGPSRATFFTGKYTHNHNVWGNYPPLGGITVFDDNSYLPMWLIDYATGLFGKWNNGYGKGVTFGKDDPRYVPSGWTDWQAYAQPVDESQNAGGMYDYRLSDNGTVIQFGHDENEYLTDELCRRTLAFIEANWSQPKFICFAPLAPHFDQVASCIVNNGLLGRTHVAPRHIGSSAGIALPQDTPLFNEADVSEKHADIRNNWPLLDANHIACIDAYWHDQLESMRAVDDAIGLILTELGENTVVIFTSDNGNLQGEHRLVRKMQPYKPSSEVPLYIYPSVKQVVSWNLASNTDLASTICEIAGVVPGIVQDGRSLLPLMANPNTSTWRKQLLLTTRNGNSNGYVGLRRSTSTEDELYVEWRNGGVITDKEFYRHQTDPDQMNSKHNDPAEQSRIAYLANILDNLKVASGNGCRLWED